MFGGEGPEVGAWLASCRGRRSTATSPSRTRRRLEPAERELYVETLLDSRLLLRGFVDRLDVAPDGAIRVVDYKTGRAPGEVFEAKALFQMKFYALVIWRTRGVVPGDAPADLPRQRRDAALRPRRGRPAGHRAQGRGALAGDPRAPRRPATGGPARAALCDWCAHQALCPAFGGTPPPLPAAPSRSSELTDGLDVAEDADWPSRSAAFRSAHSAAWVRSTTPIRWNTEVRCALTVRSLIPSRRAICLLARPCRTSAEHLASPAGVSCDRAAGVVRRAPSSCRAARGWIGDSPRLTARMPVEHVLGLGVLEQVAHRAGVERGRRSARCRRTTSAPATSAPSSSARIGRVAATPSMPGHLQVHQHDVGPQSARTTSSASAPSPAWPTTSMSPAPASSCSSPAADDGVVVDEHHPDRLASSLHLHVHRGARAGRGLRTSSRPPRRATRLAQAAQPVVPARSPVAGSKPTPSSVTSSGEPVRRPCATCTREVLGVRVPQRVAHRLLGDPPDQRGPTSSEAPSTPYTSTVAVTPAAAAGATRSSRAAPSPSAPQVGRVDLHQQRAQRPQAERAARRPSARAAARSPASVPRVAGRSRTARTPCRRGPGPRRRAGRGRSGGARPRRRRRPPPAAAPARGRRGRAAGSAPTAAGW